MEKKDKERCELISLFHFSVFLFFGKNGKIENRVRNRRLFKFSHFSNYTEKIKNSNISLLAVYSIFLIF